MFGTNSKFLDSYSRPFSTICLSATLFITNFIVFQVSWLLVPYFPTCNTISMAPDRLSFFKQILLGLNEDATFVNLIWNVDYVLCQVEAV